MKLNSEIPTNNKKLNHVSKTGVRKEGMKYDAGKIRYDLIPWECLEELAKVYSYGAVRYGDNNWQEVEVERYVAALFRHLQEWRKGNRINVLDGGLRHMAQVAWNAFALLWKEMNQQEFDCNGRRLIK